MLSILNYDRLPAAALFPLAKYKELTHVGIALAAVDSEEDLLATGLCLAEWPNVQFSKFMHEFFRDEQFFCEENFPSQLPEVLLPIKRRLNYNLRVGLAFTRGAAHGHFSTTLMITLKHSIFNTMTAQ